MDAQPLVGVERSNGGDELRREGGGGEVEVPDVDSVDGDYGFFRMVDEVEDDGGGEEEDNRKGGDGRSKAVEEVATAAAGSGAAFVEGHAVDVLRRGHTEDEVLLDLDDVVSGRRR